MRLSLKRGFGFGLTSGIITTLGLIVGLNSSSHSKIIVISGILVIAIADALSDALGMHMSVEYENNKSVKEIWESTISTFLAKFFVALTFIIPYLFLNLSGAVIVNVVWGLSMICLFSYFISKQSKEKPYKVILEHLLISIVVIIVTKVIGDYLSQFK